MHAVLTPIVLKAHGVRLEPLALAHVDGLIDASADGALATLNFTSVPAAKERCQPKSGPLPRRVSSTPDVTS